METHQRFLPQIPATITNFSCQDQMEKLVLLAIHTHHGLMPTEQVHCQAQELQSFCIRWSYCIHMSDIQRGCRTIAGMLRSLSRGCDETDLRKGCFAKLRTSVLAPEWYTFRVRSDGLSDEPSPFLAVITSITHQGLLLWSKLMLTRVASGWENYPIGRHMTKWPWGGGARSEAIYNAFWTFFWRAGFVFYPSLRKAHLHQISIKLNKVHNNMKKHYSNWKHFRKYMETFWYRTPQTNGVKDLITIKKNVAW